MSNREEVLLLNDQSPQSFDQIVKGGVTIKKLSKYMYRITFNKIGKFLVYQIWDKDNVKKKNDKRIVYYVSAKEWVNGFKKVNEGLKKNDKPLFRPTTIMETEDNDRFVFVIHKAYLNSHGRVVFTVSTKQILLENNSSSKKMIRLPSGKCNNARFDIDKFISNNYFSQIVDVVDEYFQISSIDQIINPSAIEVVEEFIPSSSVGSIDELVDFIEIQWNICADSFSKIIKIAEQDGDTTEWDTYFYDTPSSELLKNKVVLRLREYDNSKFRTSLKQNFTLDEYPIRSIEYRDKPFVCEGDYAGNREKIGCSIKHKSSTIRDAFSKDQKIVLKQFKLSVKDLKAFGPAKTRRITFKEKSLSDEELVIEIYATEAGTNFIEFSTRIESDRFRKVYEIINIWLSNNRINICPTNLSKPIRILEGLKMLE